MNDQSVFHPALLSVLCFVWNTQVVSPAAKTQAIMFALFLNELYYSLVACESKKNNWLHTVTEGIQRLSQQPPFSGKSRVESLLQNFASVFVLNTIYFFTPIAHLWPQTHTRHTEGAFTLLVITRRLTSDEAQSYACSWQRPFVCTWETWIVKYVIWMADSFTLSKTFMFRHVTSKPYVTNWATVIKIWMPFVWNLGPL